MIRASILAALGAALGAIVIALVALRARTIRGQLAALGPATAGMTAGGVAAAGLVMFQGKDLVTLAVVTGISAATGAVAAAVMAARITRPIERFRDAAGALAEGNLTVRIPEEGAAEFVALAAEFNRMAAELHRLFETRRNLVAWASHDLRAPLASLQAMIEAVEDGLADAPDYLPAMRMQVRTLSGLVDDLFELSRIETGTLALALTDVPVAELATEAVRALEADAGRKGVRLHVDGTAAVARCDPGKVARILQNLITNALRHTPADGTIGVHVAAAGADVTIAVEDTGEGLPAGEEERVFESFWRADPSRNTATGGAGLGLAIARGLVEAHGGRIWAENTGGGARFVFTLPSGS